jgi:sugar phosphate isomerase/epimerase
VLPDLGNFTISLFPPIHGDPYEGIRKLLPYAKEISAKSHDFNSLGKEKRIDYDKMFKIIRDYGFKGYVGIEYEGYKLSEYAGVKATKKILIETGMKAMVS